ncbi:MAG: MATE family efflux transporter [Firmicutes bacterium]|nr:MATE family efflux transporter [Bacillota bacterium]
MAENTRNSSTKMGDMPVLKLILTMSLPSMFSMLVSALYNIVDSIYVSRLGEYALSALSVVFPVQLLNVAVAVGTGVGLSSLISRRLGERRVDEAELAAQHGIMLAVLQWLLFLVFGLFISRPFCALFSDNNMQILDAATSYCTIVCVGSVFIMTAQCFEKIMQATGNMMATMSCMLAGAITKIILDPIMIFGLLGCPAFGVAGAAYATVIGQAVTFIVSNLIINKLKTIPVKVRYSLFKPKPYMIRDIYQVALPSMAMQAIGSVTTLALNAILVTFSSTAVAVLGVYFKLQSFVFMPVFGMNQGLLPIMGYNFGARNKDRLLQTLKYGIIIAVVIMGTGCLIFQFFPELLLSLFKAEGDLLTVGTKCLKTVSLSFPFAAICIIIGTIFQATGHGIYSLIVSVARQLVIIVPAAYILSKIIGLMGIWWAYPIAECMSLAVSLILFKRLYRIEIEHLGEEKSKKKIITEKYDEIQG